MDNNSKFRMVLAVVLCTGIFIAWQYFFIPKPAPVTDVPGTASEQISNPGGEVSALPRPDVEEPLISTPPVVVSKPNMDIGFDRESGDIRIVHFHAYKGDADEAPTFMRTDNPNANYATFMTGILTGFNLERRDRSGGTDLIFTAENEQIRVTKSYSINEDSYLIPVSITVENLTGTALSVPVTATIGPGLGQGFDNEKFVFAGPIIRTKGDTEKKAAGSVKKNLTVNDPLWGGYTSKYFLFAVVDGGFDRAEIMKYNNSAVTILNQSLTVQPGQIAEIQGASLYIGPKQYDTLKNIGHELQKSLDFGVFAFLAIPMTKVMNFAYKYVHNYGIAIIILTLIVKLITLPLTLKSMISMRAMSKLQPEMVKLREKYKDDPQKLNAATMELYRTHKVNPMSGCLPLIIQLPIFFALYKSLLVSIELKGAPFFGWIMDLSARDPYYITPVLMGVTMFIQQKMTPSTADPMQQKIFLMMPVVFTFLFLNFPSGLVVYWLTNNILSIAQQYVINKRTA